jgi:activator of 2-hydroxyglutaryl-CoA dehydratase
MRIEDFGEQALQNKNPVHIAGRCTLIAELDMIHKQQMGYQIGAIGTTFLDAKRCPVMAWLLGARVSAATWGKG